MHRSRSLHRRFRRSGGVRRDPAPQRGGRTDQRGDRPRTFDDLRAVGSRRGARLLHPRRSRARVPVRQRRIGSATALTSGAADFAGCGVDHAILAQLRGKEIPLIAQFMSVPAAGIMIRGRGQRQDHLVRAHCAGRRSASRASAQARTWSHVAGEGERHSARRFHRARGRRRHRGRRGARKRDASTRWSRTIRSLRSSPRSAKRRFSTISINPRSRGAPCSSRSTRSPARSRAPISSPNGPTPVRRSSTRSSGRSASCGRDRPRMRRGRSRTRRAAGCRPPIGGTPTSRSRRVHARRRDPARRRAGDRRDQSYLADKVGAPLDYTRLVETRFQIAAARAIPQRLAARQASQPHARVVSRRTGRSGG